MITRKCSTNGCKSVCYLSNEDEERIEAALVERGWAPDGDGQHCPIHVHNVKHKKKPDAEPVPPAQ